MSLLDDYNINATTMAKYSPLNQLSEKYLDQLLRRSQVMVFEAGEELFEKQHDLEFSYYLLRGKLKASKNIISSKSISSDDPTSKHPINEKIGDGLSVKSVTSGHMLLVDPVFLDRALGWTEAESKKDSLSSSHQSVNNSETQSDDSTEEFDEAWFDWVASLLEFPLFFNLPPSNIDALFKKFERVEVPADEIIIREGDEGDYFYLLIEGSAKVLIGEDESRPIRLGKGSYFGEEALVSETLRSATVVMNESGVLARLDKESFQSLLNDPLVKHITTSEYRTKVASEEISVYLLDIRSLEEFDHAPLPQCLHIPLSDLRNRTATMDKQAMYCLSQEGGMRSEVAAHILYQHGFDTFVIKD
jgi:CRP-like cAMP-binding protein